MEISVSEAKAKLTNLVRQARDGGYVVLTNHGRPVATIQTIDNKTDRAEWLAELVARSAAIAKEGAPAPDSADFLYDDAGLPG